MLACVCLCCVECVCVRSCLRLCACFDGFDCVGGVALVCVVVT